ncbi:MAG TPA: ABC transporter ATP-binding protein [Candidatus Hydrogenedentes bacterium]|jgi:oligopeptide/dipeptide ABC transporter ATP-binding protein|nr:MAG: Oligopeptide transport ATP-binding protein OppF [Candidatus Hydrogenedentes bacterium ADurb.Bin170]HNZ48029.1 ABC transporter ATP-binding protein [Candidatus Hydrogenedentota bacterium]HPX86195.1 ABC transporter ATP-binding protein [Candidatus Hydrogenedentota bacterium]
MTGTGDSRHLLQIEDISLRFPVRVRHGWKRQQGRLEVHALEKVSLHLHAGEVLGIVGESGCGKSTLARSIVRLETPSSGQILFRGMDIHRMGTAALKRLRPEIQMIFQDPYASLNPRMTVYDTLAEVLRIHRKLRGKALDLELAELLQKVGLAQRFVRKYPHEFSGGQRQRIAIARALAPRPSLLIADEPVSALDVSIQAQIINLLADLQRDQQLAMLFISHDLGVVRHIAHRVAVMYLGRVVESAPRDTLFRTPRHPYTQLLLAAMPDLDKEKTADTAPVSVQGEPPSPFNPPAGCVFHPRCPIARPQCSQEAPPLLEVAPEHHAACPYGTSGQ